jgi:hypothetical protein
MLRNILLLIIIILHYLNLSAQSGSYFGHIRLRTQGAVDSFAINYPGISRVNGILLIGSSDSTIQSQITDLSPLKDRLKHVFTLYIARNALLTNLSGLERIDSTGNVLIFNNPLLTNLQGLNGLRICYYDGLLIERNASLRSLWGLDSLLYPENIIIKDNPRLSSLHGLGGVQRTSELVQKRSYPKTIRWRILVHFPP